MAKFFKYHLARPLFLGKFTKKKVKYFSKTLSFLLYYFDIVCYTDKSQTKLGDLYWLLTFSACQKSLWLFCTLQKTPHFLWKQVFTKNLATLVKKPDKSGFLMAINPISSGAFAPSSSPAALLSFFCSIVFRQPEEAA